MASAACSSACIAGGELFGRPREIRKEAPPAKLCGGNVIASYASFHSHLCVTRKKHLFCGKALKILPICNEKCSEPVWMNFQSPGKLNCNEWYLEKHCRLISKAVATMEPFCFIPSESGSINDSSLWFDSNPDIQMESLDCCPELDERETLRRMRISKANKGNIPWNKGRKHSPETLQRIRERTKLAMQDPKVKMKLLNLGHAQSDETKKKIAEGVRQGWKRRRGILIIQESCLLEWKNIIAESSKKGYAGEIELQWDSYKIMDQQLKQDWIQGIEKRKSMPRPTGSKRAPKSMEQRRKISEAITAKWADPEYRNRVHTALAKYHGTTIRAERKAMRKSTGETSPEKSVSIKKKPEEIGQMNNELKSFKQLTHRKRRNSAPSFKDPMSSAKLELLKKIKADRAEIETKKREATSRAKLLIAEAERAAEALEIAALTSPLAKASLLETRKLIAEAALSIQSIEGGHSLAPPSPAEPHLDGSSAGSKANLHEAARKEQLVNGFHALPSPEIVVDVGKHQMWCEMNGRGSPPSSKFEHERIKFDCGESAARESSGSMTGEPDDLEIGAIRAKKWVRGRLVEVKD
ncbi:hypothetical protein KSP39_PZI015371 [Platanthera zijinensis]|uniref:Nuclease associated modular domain-containing protein n=1 Tax=Platanthera zijinensis TaxID=2320716 RepID=A0AAP0G1L2_9ASPA